MIGRRDLRRIHDQELPLHILEQDYIQALFIQKFYSKNESLVFKGGTFLRHAHGLDRFSEDLDFTANEKNPVDDISEAAESLSDYGVNAWIDNLEEREVSLICRLRFEGPLYQGSERSVGSIDIEVSKREDILLEPEWTRLFFKYSETRVVNALGLSKKELLAEKLRALTSRDKPRDLYDCWFLIQQGVEPDLDLFERKIKVVNGTPEVDISVTEEIWENDLAIFLQNPPEYKEVKTSLIKSLEKKGFTVLG